VTPDDCAPALPPAVVVRNEFSVVEVGYLRRGLTVSLVVTDPATGRSTVLDATELETLAAAPRESLRALLREVESGQSDEQ
jgi:hypothetical protein